MTSINRSLLDRIEAAQVKRGADSPDSESVAGDGGPPHTPGMELLIARVDGLEKRIDKVDARLDKIDDRLRGVETSLANVSGKIDTLTNSIVGKLPSWWQMPAVMTGMISLFAAIFAVAKHFHIAG